MNRKIRVIIFTAIFFIVSIGILSGCKNYNDSYPIENTILDNDVADSESRLVNIVDPILGAIGHRNVDIGYGYAIIDISYDDELSGTNYYYRISYGDDIIIEGIKEGTEPDIEIVYTGLYPVYRLHMGHGTNDFSLQYFEPIRSRKSKEIKIPSFYADYIYDDIALVAYFDYKNETYDEPILVIRDIFDNILKVEITRGFYSPVSPCETLIFLNENEIYVEYYDNEILELVKEIINFRD